MVTPTDPANPALQPLIMAGVDKLAIDVDLGAAWTKSSGAFALAPATIDLGNLARASRPASRSPTCRAACSR